MIYPLIAREKRKKEFEELESKIVRRGYRTKSAVVKIAAGSGLREGIGQPIRWWSMGNNKSCDVLKVCEAFSVNAF